MSLRDRRTVLLTLGVLTALATAACGSGGNATSGKRADAIAVAAGDDACELSDTSLPAGTHSFAVTNKGSKVTEFYVYAQGDKVMAEVENIAPGLTREVMAELPAGSYEATCKPGMVGDGVRTGLTVAGATAAASTPATLVAAGITYQAFVRRQTTELLTKTTAFTRAVRAGDIPTAKALYPQARLSWERIEPVAESFGDLDPLIDGREGDQEPGQDFTGFHRIEKALWQAGDVSDIGPYADGLLANVHTIVERANDVTLSPLQIATGSKALLDEIATGKITGEEDRYSHTDLWDVAGNLDGVVAGIDALRPFLEDADPALLTSIDQRVAAARKELGRHRAGDGWRSYDTLDTTQLRRLSDSVTALTESVSRVAAVVAKR